MTIDQEEFYEAEDERIGAGLNSEWTGGSSDGDDPGAGPEASNDVEDSEVPQERSFEVPERQGGFKWQGSVAKPELENFDTIEAFNEAMDRYENLPPTPHGDDPHGAERRDLLNWLQQCEHGRAHAEAAGDTEGIRNWDQRARLTAAELNALPDPPQVAFMKAAETGQYQLNIDVLLSGDVNLDWNNPIVQNDGPIYLAEANRRDGARVVLPQEESPFGPLANITPDSLIEFELSPSEYERFRDSVYSSGGEMDVDSILRRSWDVLRELGIDHAGRRPERSRTQANPDAVAGRPVSSVTRAAAPIRATGGSGPVSQKDPENMSQAEYERFRGRKSA